MKRLLFVAALFVIAARNESTCAQAPSGAEAQITVVPTYDENGNTLRLINVPISTSVFVIISSEAQNAVMQTFSAKNFCGLADNNNFGVMSRVLVKVSSIS